MTNLNSGLWYLLTLTILIVIASTLLFYLGMNYLEHRPVTLIESLQFVTQTMTTVGYGEFTPWNTTAMQILVIITEIAGIAIVFLSIPTVVSPWIQERIALQPPSEYFGPTNHIIISEYTDLMDTLLDELESREIPYVLIDERREETSQLKQNGRTVMLGDASEPQTLEKAGINEARLAILDGADERNAMVALAMGEFDTELDIISVAGRTSRATHLSQAGVDEIIYPRELIGRELANHALKAVGKEFDFQDPELHKKLDIREFPVIPPSTFDGQTLESSQIRTRFGTNVVGVWRRGDFISHPPGKFKVRQGDILVATGTPDQLDQLEKRMEISKTTGDATERNVVIIGFGNEGEAARSRLKEEGIDPTILNDVKRKHVDVVGNGMDEEALREANIQDADTVIICISRDEVTVMVTLMVRRMNPHAEILIQVNKEFVIEPIYRAGANYVESLTLITSRMLAGQALGEDLLSPELNIKIRHCGVGKLSGQTLGESTIAQDFNISIIALKRDEKIITDLTPDLTFEEHDEIYVCGTDEQVDRFARNFQVNESR